MSRLPRWVAVIATSSLLGGLIAAAPSEGAGSAITTVRVVTGTAIPYTTTEELLTGTINDGGQPVQYQFQYGPTTAYGKGTAVLPLPASSGNQSVAVLVTGLKPRTLYHYRLVAIAGQDSGAQQIAGNDATFKSGGTGTLVLKSTKLNARRGRLKVPLVCNSSLPCRGKFSIGATVKAVGTNSPATVACVSGAAYSIKAHMRKTVSAKLVPGCASLLKSKRKLKAKLTSYPRTGQHALIKKVTLIYKG